jgi:hypothetical protein
MAGMPASLAPLPYGDLRLRWCGLALLAFMRRWAAYLAVAATVAGAGAVGWQEIIPAVAAWLVLPLFWASTQGAWPLPATLLQAGAGAACIWGARSLLWPSAWAEAERALPIPRAATLRSDLLVVLLTLLPVGLLLVVGTASVLGHHPAWLLPTQGRALAALAVACAGAVMLGVALLQAGRQPAGRWARWRAPKGVALGVHRTESGGSACLPPGAAVAALRILSPLRWPLALLVLPLWRGPARRTGWTLLLGSAAVAVPALGLTLLQGGEPWWLVACSGLALLVATRVNHLARLETAELFDACRNLPVAPAPLQHARAALGLLAVLPGIVGLCTVALGGRAPGLRVAVLATWALACLGGCTVEVLSAPADAATKAGRWLFTLVLCICLATEVLA